MTTISHQTIGKIEGYRINLLTNHCSNLLGGIDELRVHATTLEVNVPEGNIVGGTNTRVNRQLLVGLSGHEHSQRHERCRQEFKTFFHKYKLEFIGINKASYL